MYRRILVAVDGSDISTRALEEALRLCKDQHAQVRIVHAVDLVPSVDEGYVDFDAYEREELEKGQAILNRAVAVARGAGVEPESSLVEVCKRRISTAIVDEAKRWEADLIVMGTHGRSGLTQLLLGSVTEGVVRSGLTPVLLVRAAAAALQSE